MMGSSWTKKMRDRNKRFERIYGEEIRMADFYKLENEVAKLKDIVENLSGRLDLLEDLNLAERLDKIESSAKFLNIKQLDERHTVLDDVFDKMDEEGLLSDIVGKTTDEVNTLVVVFAKLKGIDLGEGSARGIKQSITRRIQTRYNLDLDKTRKKYVSK